MIRQFKPHQTPMRVYRLACFFALLLVPLLQVTTGVDFYQSLLAMGLIIISLYPTARYFRDKHDGIPALSLLCVAYAIQFGLPVFTRDAEIELALGDIKALNDADVIAALVMATIGMLSLQLGYYWFYSSRFRETIRPVSMNLSRSKAKIYCVVAGLMLPLMLNSRGIIPEQYQLPLSSILRLLENQTYVVIGVLGWLVFSKQVAWWYGVWLYTLIVLAMITGVSQGSLESALIPLAVLFVVKWLNTGRAPWVTVVLVIGIILFLSPVKAEYRQQVWFDQDTVTSDQSTLTKASFWVEKAVEYWQGTFAGDRNFEEATSNAAGRADFIHQVAHIYSLTPSVVPYQNGGTYSYFAVALIPRVLWPDKPLAGTANDFFAVSYGIATEEGIKRTTFGVSLLGESFINFGWYGVVFVMFLLGVSVCLCQHIFGNTTSGAGSQAIFLAFFVFFLNGIGSSAEILFGNIIQNLFCAYVLLLWARNKSVKLALPRMSSQSQAGVVQPR